MKIIANVKVGRAIAIEVAEHGGQTPVIGRADRLAVFAKESSVGPVHRHKAAVAGVAEEDVSFAVFQDAAAIVETEAAGKFGCRRRASVHSEELEHAVSDGHAEPDVGHVTHGVIAVVDDVEVEQTVTVNVGECHRGAGSRAVQTRPARGFGETSLAVIEEQARAAADAIDQQIEVAVAVHVGKGGAGGGLIGAGHTGGGGNIGKVPIAQVAIERVGRVQAAEIQVREAVAIDVAGSDAGPVQKNLVGERSLLAEVIGEGDAGGHGADIGEAGLSPRGNGQRRATMTFQLLPVQRGGAESSRGGQGDQAAQEMTARQHG